MTDFRARIGRIRMKNGGADVHVLDRKSVNRDGDDWRGTLVKAARSISELGTDKQPLVGYFIVGFFADGSASTGFRYDPDHLVVPRALMPAWVAEIVRRDMVTDPECRNIFDQKFEWVE